MIETLWQELEGDNEIRQGDVIRRFATGDASSTEWGVVINADCDIAQGRSGGRFTFIEIVPAQVYLSEVWAPQQLGLFVKRQSKAAAEQIGGVIKRSGLGMNKITAESLIEWLTESTVAQIESVINKSGKPLDAKLTKTLNAIRIAIDSSGEQNLMERLRQARTAFGDDDVKIGHTIKEAFNGDHGFPDFFLLPELPEAPGIGFVALLRAFSTVQAADLFMSETDARIEGQPEAFHRIARLSDRLRFAIVQKIGFLFMRIGMATHFEKTNLTVTDLVIEELLVGAKN